MINSVIIGHMLGDGHIAKVQKGNSYFTVHRKAGHHGYNLWTKNVLLKTGLIVSNTYPKIRESLGSHSFPSSYLRTSRNKFWSEQRKLWYKNGIKELPKVYIQKYFNDTSFMLWFLDDGDAYGRISADSFSLDDIFFLRELIDKKYGIKFHIRSQFGRPHHHILVCPKASRENLSSIFRLLDFKIPSMSYKLKLI